jgi:hypothetical protein
VRDRRAQYSGVGHAGQLDVIKKAPGASHQLRVFAPAQRLTNVFLWGLNGCCHDTPLQGRSDGSIVASSSSLMRQEP